MRYQTHVHPDPESAGWLLVDVEGVGRTQAATVGEACDAALDLIRTMTQDRDPEVELIDDERPRLAGG